MSKTYIGIYLDMRYTNQEIEREVLMNSKGKIFSKGNFDPKTGEELIKKKLIEVVEIIPDPYIDDDKLYKETFTRVDLLRPMINKKNDFFILNTSSDKYCRYLNKYEIHTFVDNNTAKKLIKSFKEDFKKHLKHYTNKGYEFSIHCGVINLK